MIQNKNVLQIFRELWEMSNVPEGRGSSQCFFLKGNNSIYPLTVQDPEANVVAQNSELLNSHFLQQFVRENTELKCSHLERVFQIQK